MTRFIRVHTGESEPYDEHYIRIDAIIRITQREFECGMRTTMILVDGDSFVDVVETPSQILARIALAEEQI